MARGLGRILLIALPALVLWMVLLITADDPVLGAGLGRETIEAAAILATAGALVLWLGALILLFLGGPERRTITGFERAAVYGLLAFAVGFLTLRYFGFAIGTILTTSALVTAAIGFAMQPTLSSVIAGMALNTDRELHIGDTVMQDANQVTITALGWRAAKGRRNDGAVVVIPNAKLSDAMLEIVPRRQPLRFEFLFTPPAAANPLTVCALAQDVASAMTAVDAARPVQALPETLGADGGVGQIRLHLWLLPPYDRSGLQGQFLLRFRHACQRHGLIGSAEDKQQAAREAARLLGLPAATAQKLAEEATLLLFAPGEKLVMPLSLQGCRFLLLRGEAAEPTAGELRQEDGAPVPRAVAAARLTAALTDIIGPYAAYVTERAAAQDYAGFGAALASEIDDPVSRSRFLAEAGLGGMRFQAGAFLAATPDAAGTLSCGRLEAAGETALLAIPDE